MGAGSRLVLDRFVIAPERKSAQIVAFVIIGLGIVLCLLGAWLIVIGVRDRSVVERVPV